MTKGYSLALAKNGLTNSLNELSTAMKAILTNQPTTKGNENEHRQIDNSSSYIGSLSSTIYRPEKLFSISSLATALIPPPTIDTVQEIHAYPHQAPYCSIGASLKFSLYALLQTSFNSP